MAAAQSYAKQWKDVAQVQKLFHQASEHYKSFRRQYDGYRKLIAAILSRIKEMNKQR